MAGKVEQQRLADGSYQITCRTSMDACVREIENTCLDKRYRILSGTSEVKLRDASPNETAYPTSHLTFACSDYGAVPALASLATAKVCAPGDTRACVGVGACAGGQVCRPDGTGFGSCECAPSAGDAGAPPPSSASLSGGSDAGRASQPAVDAGASIR
jgi:hypothetical protein